ncbi:hypothetical protein [Stenotrophomonas sp.]|uniref:hypothetical protein n=1 Tax=Stenotrophomonas sp. TaxID=69392 RepID=UPI0028A21F00|nr:hypothetical protein [Stenotrophomonas sp.]
MTPISLDETVSTQQEIETHELELQALLARILPLRELAIRLDGQQEQLDLVRSGLDELNTEGLPGLMSRAIQAEKNLGKVGRDLEFRHDELLAVLDKREATSAMQAQQTTELLLAAQNERGNTSTALSMHFSALGHQLSEAEASRRSLAGTAAESAESARRGIEALLERLNDRIDEASQAQRQAVSLSSESLHRLRRLMVATLVLAGLGATTGLAALALSLAG